MAARLPPPSKIKISVDGPYHYPLTNKPIFKQKGAIQLQEKWVDKMLDQKYHANFMYRILSFFYDVVVLVVALTIVGSITTWWMFSQTNAPDMTNMNLVREYMWENEFHLFVINWIVLAVVAILIQYVYPAFSKQQTVGMMMTGLYLRDENAKKIDKRQYLKRELMKLYLFPTVLLTLRGERPLYDEKSKTYLLK